MMKKNKILLIISILLLLAPISIEANDGIHPTGINTQVEEVLETNSNKENLPLAETSSEIKNTDISESEQAEPPYKTPYSKRKIVKKFLAAMLGVVISSVLLFVLLSIYNKIRENLVGRQVAENTEPSPETPKDMTSAIRIFLEKTNWK